MPQYEIGFIGAGNMAEALCRGIISAKLVSADRIIASDVSEQRRTLFSERLSVKTVGDNAAAAREAATVILAVKPQHVAAVLGDVGSLLGPKKLVISIVTGVRSARIEAAAPPGCRVVRVMPNTPMLVGKGMAALCAGANATPEDAQATARMFACAAEVVTVEEDALDAVTAVSGSGPAYFFYLVEAMIEAGTAEGLPRAVAEKLAARTLLGAGQLLVTSGEGAADLRRKVTSPGGTTEAAVGVMDRAGVRDTLVTAVRRAAERSRELSRG